jgi:adenine deaminase
MSITNEELIDAAMGRRPCDLVLKNGRIVNVFSGEVHPGDIGVYKKRIVGIDSYSARREIDLKGNYVCPGFFDGHVHIESSMVTLREYAKAVVPRGTTSIVADPHEIANVLGLEGIKYMLETGEGLPINLFLMLSSCVPATALETSGASLSAFDLSLFLDSPNVLGLAEVMNYWGVVNKDPDVMAKILKVRGKRIDGHAPELRGDGLNAYIAAGIRSDHECTTLEEASEKLRRGMYIMIREGTTAKNLLALLPLVTSENSSKFFFVTDDKNPQDLLKEGHINSMIKSAIDHGVEPIRAIQMATLNTSDYFKIDDLGAIAPGYRADLVVFDDFSDLNVKMVFKDGALVAKEGRLTRPMAVSKKVPLRSTINVKWIEESDFDIGAKSKLAKVIELIPDQIITRKRVLTIKVKDGLAVPDIEDDILKISVIERHMASGNTGLGFVRGFNLKEGALASSVSHDSHNIIVLGTNDEDMYKAAVRIVKLRGGLVVVKGGEIVEELPLPIGGLMSEQGLEEVALRIDRLNAKARELGCRLKDPFMALSFLTIPVIPELRLTDKGLVDANEMRIVELFE